VRTAYNSFQALADTGGFASVIAVVFTFITFRIQKILYYLAAAQRFFLCLEDQRSSQSSYGGRSYDPPSKGRKGGAPYSDEMEDMDPKSKAKMKKMAIQERLRSARPFTYSFCAYIRGAMCRTSNDVKYMFF
jgi:hypothetical protein